MRTPLAALVIVAAASGASAQSSKIVELPEARSNPDGPVLSMGLPLPRIGLPLPVTGLPPEGAPKARAPERRRSGDKGGRRRGKGDRRPSPVAVAIVPYFWPYAVYDDVPAGANTPALPPASADRAPTGTLYLDVQPSSVQLFVDGYYVGTADDLTRGVQLEAVPHRLEFRAPGYDPLALDVNIPAEGVTTYRGALTPARTAAAAAAPMSSSEAAPARPATFYVIPGCYLGNVPPKDAGLPPSCDESRAVTVPQR
jgi:hypothetical protein